MAKAPFNGPAERAASAADNLSGTIGVPEQFVVLCN